MIETILAAFEMEEIIYELRDHMAGLNAGRWDYIFSMIKKLGKNPDFILPDRSKVGMTVPFMSVYSRLLVKTCHKRGAHAIGGMSAFIPSKDTEANRTAFEKVTADKLLEASQGYDGTWVAHPGLVSVAMEQFNKFIGDGQNQKNEMREDVRVSAEDLLNTKIEGGTITEEGVRLNINVGILYIESWLGGIGAAAIYNLMEDAATAEISRAQIWQWIHHRQEMADGRILTFQLYQQFLSEEKKKIVRLLGLNRVNTGRLQQAVAIFDQLVKSKDFNEFLTLGAYKQLN